MVIDWTRIYKKYKGLWIGLKKDQKTVVASGKSVKEVLVQAAKQGYKDPILFRVPNESYPYVGYIR